MRRGAAAGSDNNTTVKLKLRNTISSRSGGQHSDVEKLGDFKVKTAFILQLQNKFQVLADAEDQTLVFLQVITMIVALYHCKECFCCFVTKLRCCQGFFSAKKVFACLQLYHANCSRFSLKWKFFPFLVQNCNVLTFFRTGNGFKLFEANHVVLTLIWSTATFLLLAGNLRSFRLYRIENPLCVSFLLLRSFYIPWTKTAFLAFLGQLTDFS